MFACHRETIQRRPEIVKKVLLSTYIFAAGQLCFWQQMEMNLDLSLAQKLGPTKEKLPVWEGSRVLHHGQIVPLLFK
jgi:hypothetical protein